MSFLASHVTTRVVNLLGLSGWAFLGFMEAIEGGIPWVIVAGIMFVYWLWLTVVEWDGRYDDEEETDEPSKDAA